MHTPIKASKEPAASGLEPMLLEGNAAAKLAQLLLQWISLPEVQILPLCRSCTRPDARPPSPAVGHRRKSLQPWAQK